MQARVVPVAVAILGLALAMPAGAQSGASRVVVSGLEFPAGIAFLPDDRMIVTERPGRVRVIEGRRLVEEPLATIPTTTSGEAGLLGVAAPPDVEADPAVYVFSTEPDGSSNTVWRVPLDGTGVTRVVTGMPAAVYHNGGGVSFGDDGKLYVSNGEVHQGGRAQDPQAPGGKVYRYNPDGSIPDDNPFDGSATFALGLRNPFGMTLDPVDGHLWVTENGPESFDEINRIEAGKNYGWPEVSGPGCSDDCIDPVLAYESIIVPTGIAFAGDDAPRRFRGDLFFATYGERAIHRVQLNDNRHEAISDEILIRSDEPVVALAWGPRGLYYSTPSQVRVIELRGGGKRENSPAPDESESPEGSPSPAGSVGDDGPGAPGGAIAALVLAALAVAFFGLRARMDRHAAEDAVVDPGDR